MFTEGLGLLERLYMDRYHLKRGKTVDHNTYIDKCLETMVCQKMRSYILNLKRSVTKKISKV